MRSAFASLLLLFCALPPGGSPQAQGTSQRPTGLASRLGAPETRELAGKTIQRFPHFQYTRTFNEGDPIRIAFDPMTDTRLARRRVEVYLILHEKLPLYLAGKKLESLLGQALEAQLILGSVKENIFLLDAGSLGGRGSPDAQGTVQLGVGYDIVVDVNRNSLLDGADLMDGSPEEAGFYVVDDFVTVVGPRRETGPYEVTEVLFDGGTNFTREKIYYPAQIADMGALPLIVISHGNGHDYRWYDHMGYMMGSWGYVVMSHANNTGPGIQTASSSTLLNTNLILSRTDEIAEGALVGHIDGHRIVWMGHSRGGEGVVRAYNRVETGTVLATAFGLEDIKLVSSIAPTDFLGPTGSNMGAAPYHLWTGGADNDVNGCANCDICQTFHLLERADGTRYSISLHGAGHGDFHAGGGSSVAQGPCRIGRDMTHRVMRAYFLPLVQWVLDGNPACLDYVTRQWEEFRALGAPNPDLEEGRCSVVDLMYLPGPERERFVVDDFQSQPELTRSSSGGQVLFSAGLIPHLLEGRYDDANSAFTVSDTDPMNGMTLAGPGDTSAGCVLEWNGTNEWLIFEVPDGRRDLTDLRTLSFRAAQASRDELTIAEQGDLDFAVQLTDRNRRSSLIRISAYGGGIEEPYLRGSCGQDRGWANEFETIRIPLNDFRRDGNPLDLSDVVAISFRFGPAHGSHVGRIGLDEIVITGD